MEKYNFYIDKDKNKINWVYNNKEYSIEINGLKLATIGKDENEDEFIYVENRTENDERQKRYYTLTGELFFTFIKLGGLVSWKNKDGINELFINQLIGAEIYKKYQVIGVLKGNRDTQRKLIIYSMDGQLISEQDEPENYYFSYLTYDDEKPAVICEGNGKNGSRKNGRSTWKFSINPVTGELIRISVAY